MFETSIHWTTFFYLLVDIFIVLITLYLSKRRNCSSLKNFLYLGFIFITYKVTGGFLPIKGFPGPYILQYVITYGVAISLCVYMIYYLYKEYDIVVLEHHFSIKNLAIISSLSFLVLFLIIYLITNSLDSARFLFTVPISLIAFVFLFIFYRRISNPSNPNPFILR